MPLSQDEGTPGQENLFVPEQRDNGTSRLVETLVDIHRINKYINKHNVKTNGDNTLAANLMARAWNSSLEHYYLLDYNLNFFFRY